MKLQIKKRSFQKQIAKLLGEYKTGKKINYIAREYGISETPFIYANENMESRPPGNRKTSTF
jgi:hypothetical protein